ncbi:MAG: replicative DNA helicase [Deltaproteobacteria bacterium]|nr:replicative DNA helicase [Deltaproteobacteria bacterium]
MQIDTELDQRDIVISQAEDGQSDHYDFDAPQSAGRVPPHAIDAEQAALGAVLLDNEAIYSVMDLLQPNDFYKHAHQLIYATMLKISESGQAIDLLTLSNELKCGKQLDAAGGVEYLSLLVDNVPTAANTQYYARVVKEMSLRRKLIHEASEIVTEAFSTRGDIETFVDSVEQRIFSVSESRTRQGFVKLEHIVRDSIKQVEKLYTKQEPITGVPSGFIDFDEMTSGLQPSDLIIIAGRPSMGKTSLALSIVRNIAVEAGKAVAVFSLEMSKEQLVTRLLSSEARVSSAKMRSGKFGEGDFIKLVDAASKISGASIFIDDTPALSVLEMRAKARRLHRERALSAIVIDYLQLMRAPQRARGESREQEIAEISRSLKAIAKELSIPVIALSQLNRAVETRNDKRPLMADLRESGAIEQDADIIGFVYRDEVYNPDTQDKGIAELIIGKHRNGPIGTVQLAFHSDYTSFENLSKTTDEYDYFPDGAYPSQEEDILP